MSSQGYISPWTSLPSNIYAHILTFDLSPADICSVASTCSTWHHFLNNNHLSGRSVWRHLLRKEWNISDEYISEFSHDGLWPRSLYIAYFLSRVSVADMFHPNVPGSKARKEERAQRWALVNGISPFWILHLHYTNPSTRSLEVTYTKDQSSWFGRVLKISETFRIQIEGSVQVRFAGYYQVVWRIKLVNHYDLAPLKFLTCVLPILTGDGNQSNSRHSGEVDEKESGWLSGSRARSKFKWNYEDLIKPVPNPGIFAVYTLCPLSKSPSNVHPSQSLQTDARNELTTSNYVDLLNPLGIMQHLQLANESRPLLDGISSSSTSSSHNDSISSIPLSPSLIPEYIWFDLTVGYIHVPFDENGVCFALINNTPGWKSGLYIDYVSLVPITLREYQAHMTSNSG